MQREPTQWFVTLRRRRATCRRNQVPTHIERKYQQARHQFCAAMRQAKQACWEELIEQVSSYCVDSLA